MDASSFVLLENLPASFTQKTLQSIISHLTCKGRVLSSNVISEASSGEKPFAQVYFEKVEDAEEAVKLWDQLTIDGTVVTAWNAATTQKRAKKSTRAVSALRYPFAPMSITWLFTYVNGLKNPRRSVAMCRILECFMCTAISVNDPLMEHAVMQFYTKFSPSVWGKAQSQNTDGVAFELCRQVFEVIGLVKKYPGANAKSKKMLLTLVERVVEDVSRVVLVSKSLGNNKAIPEIVSSVRGNIATLRAQTELSEQSLNGLVSWLKFLFSCLSSHQNPSQFPDNATFVSCSEDCPCFQTLSCSPAMLLGDVEKVKIIDTFVTSAIREGNNDMATIAIELLDRFTVDFCFSVLQHVQNGEYGALRLYVFQAIRLATSIQGHCGTPPVMSYNFIEAALHRLKESVSKEHNASLKHMVPLIDNALSCVFDLRSLTDIAASAVQQLYTLQFDLTQLFNVLAAPQYSLCLHVGTAGFSAEAKGDRGATSPVCACPTCDGNNTELLKCSGCKVTYYCSTACQKADWKSHRTICKELAARRMAAPVEVPRPLFERVIVPCIEL